MITISSQSISNWTYGGTSATLRIFATTPFFTEAGDYVVQGNINQPDSCHQSVTCTVSGTSLTIPQFTLAATTNSSVPTAKYVAYLYDENGDRRMFWLNAAFAVNSIDTTQTWEQIDAYTRAWANPRPAQTYYTADQIDRMFEVAPANAVNTTDTRLLVDLSDYDDTIEGAVAAIGNSQVRLTVTTPVTVTGTVVMPANILFEPRALVTVSGSLTIGAMADVGNTKVFEADGGTLRFARGFAPELNLAWLLGTDPTATTAAKTKTALGHLVASTVDYGGVISIPSGTWTTNGEHIISDATIIKGNTMFTAAGLKGTTLVLGSGSYLFKLGEGEYSTAFQDICLDGNGAGIGVLMQGASPNTSGAFFFDRVTFDSFTTGVKVNSTSGSWQTAQVGFKDCVFQGCTTGIYTNSVNQGITLVNTNFAVPASGLGWDNAGSGLVTFVGGEAAGAGASSKFMVISAAHAAINFLGFQDENFGTMIQNDASDVSGIINFSEGCLIQSKIQLNQSCKVFISKCNLMSYAIQGAATGATVSVDDCYIRQVSVNDGVTVVSPAVLLGVGSGVRVVKENLADNGQFIQRIRQKILSPSGIDENTTTPTVEILMNTGSGIVKRQLRIGRADSSGVADYYYDIYRDYSTGYLNFAGNQTGFIRYIFDDAVKALRFIGNVDTISSIGTNQNNYSTGSLAKHQRLTASGAVNITGLSLAQADGDEYRFYNVGSNTITFKHQDAASTADNRFICSTGADIALGAGGILDLFYDGSSARWRIASL